MIKIAIIGANGQLGSDLLRVFAANAIGLTHEDIEVTDEVGAMSKVQALNPAWVINTAAFNRVDDCETNPALAFAVNSVGAFNVARAAAAVGAGVVYFSSDYVFGAEQRTRGQPYVESDLPAPLGVYGASKCAGEHLVQIGNARHIIIRTTGLYGQTTSRKGWTFPELMLQKARSDQRVSVVDDQIMTPTYTLDLANCVKGLIDCGARGLFHVTNAGECSWCEFTRELFRLAGVTAELIPITTEQSQRRARRPAYSAMTSTRLQIAGVSSLRPWQDALRDYLAARGELK